MSNFSRTCLAVLFLSLASVGVGHAKGPDGNSYHHDRDDRHDRDDHHDNDGGPFSTPEINPSMATGAFALMSGGIMVLRGRRKV